MNNNNNNNNIYNNNSLYSLLLYLNWSHAKEIETINSYFILCNKYYKKQLHKCKYNFKYEPKIQVPRNKPKFKYIEQQQLHGYKVELGIDSSFLKYIYDKLIPTLNSNGSLSSKTQIDIMLTYLKDGCNQRVLKNIFSTSKSTICRVLKHMIPHTIAIFRDAIQMPKRFHIDDILAIDCSDHRINRCHPGSTEYYRCDTGHTLTSQVICMIRDGTILDVAIAKGKVNDPGMSLITKINDFIGSNDLVCLGDGAYTKTLYISPKNIYDFLAALGIKHPCKETIHTFQFQHSSIRSMVERVIGLAKEFKVIAHKSPMDPVFHSYTILLCYLLTNIRIAIHQNKINVDKAPQPTNNTIPNPTS